MNNQTSTLSHAELDRAPAFTAATAELTSTELDAVYGGTVGGGLFGVMNSIVNKFDESTQKVLQKLGQG